MPLFSDPRLADRPGSLLRLRRRDRDSKILRFTCPAVRGAAARNGSTPATNAKAVTGESPGPFELETITASPFFNSESDSCGIRSSICWRSPPPRRPGRQSAESTSTRPVRPVRLGAPCGGAALSPDGRLPPPGAAGPPAAGVRTEPPRQHALRFADPAAATRNLDWFEPPPASWFAGW